MPTASTNGTNGGASSSSQDLRINFFRSPFRDKLLDFLSKAEGRDKFCKIIQFGSRFLGRSSSFPSFPQDLVLRSRKVHWLGKWLFELRTAESTLETFSIPRNIRYFHAASRLCFAWRWLFENLSLFHRWSYADKMNVYAKRWWSIALVCGVITEVLKLKRIRKLSSSVESRRKSRNNCLLTILVHCADAPIPLLVGWLGGGGSSSFSWHLSRPASLSHLLAAVIQSMNLW